MRLKGVKIGNVTYFVNEMQIKEAGGVKEAAKAEDLKRNPPKKVAKKKED